MRVRLRRLAILGTIGLLAACSKQDDAAATTGSAPAGGVGATPIAAGGTGAASNGEGGAAGGGTGGAAIGNTSAPPGGDSGLAGDAGGGAGGSSAGDAGLARLLPPANAGLDYQLGGAYPPPAGVGIVSRDRTDAPAAGLYNLCYLNGFQVQPGEENDWAPDLVLRDMNGDPIVDPDWNELLLDPTTPDKRSRIAEVVGGWIDACAVDGFDAVEIDNLDSYSRSGGRISEDDAVALLALLSARAHAAGLAVGQKNSVELVGRKDEMGTDFCVAEECSAWSECGDYVAVYGDAVLMIEYDDADFAQGCADWGATHSIVRRDLNLVTPERSGYVFDGC